MKQHLRDSWWGRHDVLLMVGGKTLSAFGDAVLAIVLLLRVHDAGAGFLAVAALLACEALPMLALMGLAGRIADSRDSRTVLTMTTAGQAAACLGLLVVHALPATLALVLVMQTLQAINQATWSGLTPQVAGEEHIAQVVALQQALGAFAAPLGAAVGPFLAGIWGTDLAIGLDAASFAALTGAVLLIRTRRHVHPDTDVPAVSSLATLRRDRMLWLLVLGLVPVVVALVAVNVLDVFLVRDDLGIAARWYGLSALAWGLGAIAGSVLAGAIKAATTRLRIALVALGAIGLFCIATGLSPNFPIYLLCGLGVGIANGTSNACFGAMILTRTADADRGKVSAAVNGIVQGGSLVGLPLGGLLGGAFGTRPSIIGAGVISLLAVGLVTLRIGRLDVQLDDAAQTYKAGPTPVKA